jgi:hypothetical protein
MKDLSKYVKLIAGLTALFMENAFTSMADQPNEPGLQQAEYTHAVLFQISEERGKAKFANGENLVEIRDSQRQLGIYVGMSQHVYLLRVEVEAVRPEYDIFFGQVSGGQLNVYCYKSRPSKKTAEVPKYLGVVCQKRISTVKFHHMTVK